MKKSTKNGRLHLLIALAMVFALTWGINLPVKAGNPASKLNPTESQNQESVWTLGFSDELIQIFYQKVACDGKERVMLKVVNKSLRPLKFNCQLWKESKPELISISSLETQEGLCASGYNYPLVFTIPSEQKEAKLSIIINYLNQ